MCLGRPGRHEPYSYANTLVLYYGLCNNLRTKQFGLFLLWKLGGILLVEVYYGSHTMKAYGELITHLISTSKTKNYKSGLY